MVRAKPELLAASPAVTVAGAEREVVRRAGTDAHPILRLAGCTSREDAEALRGEELRVPRSVARPLEDDEFWADDVVGCRVVDGERDVGTVKRMLAYPSCELLEVTRADGGADLLVPLVRDAVRGVDLATRTIDVDLLFLGEGEA